MKDGTTALGDCEMTSSNIQVAQRVREQFDAYFLGLTFTVLGLSIQTAKFGTAVASDWLELTAWTLLLVSGIAGLSRMELIPEIHRRFDLQDERAVLAHEGKMALAKGQKTIYDIGFRTDVPLDDFIARQNQEVARVEESLRPLHRQTSIAYTLMRVAFIGGMVSLVAARAIGPFRHLIAP